MSLPQVVLSPKQAEERELKEKKRLSLIEVYKLAAIFYYKSLNNLDTSHRVITYIRQRGITKQDIKKFGIGYAHGGNKLSGYLIKQGYSEDFLYEAGLIAKSKKGSYYDWFFNRLIFPIFDDKGAVIAFGGRTLDGNEPKYLNSKETLIFNKSRTLYNLNNAKKNSSRELILVEGYMDVVAMSRAGFESIAAMGTSFNEGHVALIRRYGDAVTMLFDSDSAGYAATMRAGALLVNSNIVVKVAELGQAKDPDEFIIRFGAALLKQRLEAAEDFSMFKINRLKKGKDLNNINDKVKFITEVSKILKGMTNKLELDAYVQEVSSMTNISKEAMYAEIRSLSGESIGMSINKLVKPMIVAKKGLDYAKSNIIYLIHEDAELYEKLKDVLSPDEILDEVYSRLLRYIYEAYEQGEGKSCAELISRFDNLEEQKKVASVFSDPIFLKHEEKQEAINNFLLLIKYEVINNKISNEKDIREIDRLLQEKRNMQKMKNIF
jgi:DNA primase